MAIDGIPSSTYFNGFTYGNLVLACAITAPRGFWNYNDVLVLKVRCTANLTAFQLRPAWIKQVGSESSLIVVNFRNEAVVTPDGDFYVLTCNVGSVYYDYSSSYPYFAIYSTNPAEITGLELISFEDRKGEDKTSTIVFDYPGLATHLSTPTGLYADNITSDSARVSWSAVENASGYKVEYRQSAGGGQTYPWVEAQN